MGAEGKGWDPVKLAEALPVIYDWLFQGGTSIVLRFCYMLFFSFKQFCTLKIYSRLSLSRTRLSRITAYLEVIIWSLF